MRKEGESIPSESSEKTSRVWNEHRSDLAIRRAQEILVSRLDGKMQLVKPG